MYKHLLFRKSSSFDELEISKLKTTLNLKPDYSYDNTTMYENDDLRVSIDDSIIRILVYDGENYKLLRQLKTIFYGQRKKQ